MAAFNETVQSAVCVVLFTYLGVATRLGLAVLSDLAGDSVLPKLGSAFFLPNIFGSFVMGVAAPLTDHFRGRAYWHVGIMSGFCGSCTTFSTWQKTTADYVLAGRVVDSLALSSLTYCTSYTALLCGRHFGECLSRLLRRSRKAKTCTEKQECPKEKARKRFDLNLDVALVLVFLLLINAALWTSVFVDRVDWRRRWWVSAGLAPAGSLIRYASSLYNKNFPNFPVFTFMVNVGSSVIATLFLVVQHFLASKKTSTADGNLAATYEFWAMDGVSVGLLASLSTVSTFVNELYKFCAAGNTGHAYRYGAATILVSQVLCVLVRCVMVFY